MVLVSDFANGESMQQFERMLAGKEGKGNACKAKTSHDNILPLEKKYVKLTRENSAQKIKNVVSTLHFSPSSSQGGMGFNLVNCSVSPGLMAGSETNISLR